MNKTLTALLVLVLATASLHAQDRLFTYTYQSGVLNKGQREIEVWNTLRSSRDNFYRALDSRIEFETGLSKNLQTAFYLNIKNAAEEKVVTSEGGTEQSVIETSSDWSFSNEWKYKLSDAAANAIGSALYGEITVAPSEFELEFKFILDKQIGNTTQALNISSEMEWEAEVENETDGQTMNSEVEQEFESKLNLDYGFSYHINTNWNVGFELNNLNHFDEGELEYSVLYAGPGISYLSDGFWINFTLMPQVAGLKNPENYGSGRYLAGQEKVHARLVFSITL
ncbi:MAG TPA: DUF6662 family protein [Bacteroidia bacterium]|nr:DUF6662 family protein [Bacteroidia bacterium]